MSTGSLSGPHPPRPEDSGGVCVMILIFSHAFQRTHLRHELRPSGIQGPLMTVSAFLPGVSTYSIIFDASPLLR
jgi:hypothetical protein